MNTLYYGEINPSDAYGATSLVKGGNILLPPFTRGAQGGLK